MEHISNPFSSREGYFCFGCSPDNSTGLNMEFIKEGNKIISYWQPKKHLEGYPNVLHGGIQATLMDEIASWAVYTLLETAGVTAYMNTRFKKPVYLDKGPLRLEAIPGEVVKRIAAIDVKLFNCDDVLCATGDIGYFVYPKEIAKAKMNYPGRDKFFK